MMVQYLLDAGAQAPIPGVDAPQNGFGDVVEPVALALDQEKRVTEQINALAATARAEGDYSSEQFMQWFIKEQIEEVASMNDLLKVVQRAKDNPLLAEEYLARETPGDEGADPTAPPVAGGAPVARPVPRRAARGILARPCSAARSPQSPACAPAWARPGRRARRSSRATSRGARSSTSAACGRSTARCASPPRTPARPA